MLAVFLKHSGALLLQVVVVTPLSRLAARINSKSKMHSVALREFNSFVYNFVLFYKLQYYVK